MAICQLCNHFGPAKMKYELDLAREHAKTHFLQLNIIGDQASADEIFDKCFPLCEETAARRGTTRAFSCSRQILVDLCKSVFPRERILDSPSHIPCGKCGVELKLLVRRDTHLNTTALIAHAGCHLDGKKLYACRHCSRRYSTCDAVRSHLNSAHRITSADGHFENKTDYFVKEISLLIESCFGPNNKKAQFDKEWAETTSRIRRRHKGSELSVERHLLCHQLIRKISDRNKIAQCRLCSSRLSVKRVRGYSSHHAMQHVLLHFEKPTLRCRTCGEAFTTRNKLNEHLRNIHSLPSINNYDCLEDQNHTGILALLKSCYGTNVDGDSTGDMITPKSAKLIREHTKGSKRAIERKLLCYRLIQKFGNFEKQLHCRLCPTMITTVSFGGACRTKKAMRHALLHLTMPLFRCKQCSMVYSCSDSMQLHLRRKHALPLDKNHVCSLDEYHYEILTKLRECYGDERE